MITTRCPVCVGKKTIVGLGCLLKKCPRCKGIGHVEVKEEGKKDNKRGKL